MNYNLSKNPLGFLHQKLIQVSIIVKNFELLHKIMIFDI